MILFAEKEAAGQTQFTEDGVSWRVSFCPGKAQLKRSTAQYAYLLGFASGLVNFKTP